MSSLSNYFIGIATKRLVAGELPYDPIKGRTSTQHEFNATKEMVTLFGTERIESKPCTYLYMSDKEDEFSAEHGSFSFYNARENKPRLPEYRFYYNSKNATLGKANEGDLLIVAKTTDRGEIIIVAEKNSTVEQQLVWLFGVNARNMEFEVKDMSVETKKLEFVQKYVLDAIGIEAEVEIASDNLLEKMLQKFRGILPRTFEFSEFARIHIRNINAIEDPDEALVRWYEKEYELFKLIEKHLIQKKLKEGFGNDGLSVDEFLKFSLSVHQRRKSRSGDAFENHLEEIFNRNLIKFTSQARIGKAKPDFIFPGQKYYEDPGFPLDLITMLGAKTTAKERWKQLIPETKISSKYFITLEPAISQNQTSEMIEKQIQLVIPISIIPTYKEAQRKSIITLKDFIKRIKINQRIVNID